jgi:DEAD/DEAH box helicase domain-containing protein
MQGLELPVLTQWLWGTLTQMRQRGGVLHPTLGNYAADGNVWALRRTGGRGDWMPGMGQSTPRPVMLTLGRQTGFDRLTGSSRTTWYKQWALAVLGHQTLIHKQLAADFYGTASDAMIADGILARTAHHQGDTLAINDTDLAFLTTDGNKRRLAVPRQNADHLRNMPCLDAMGSRYHNVTPTAGEVGASLQQGASTACGRGRTHRPAGGAGTGGTADPFQGPAPEALVRELAVGHAHVGDGGGHR